MRVLLLIATTVDDIASSTAIIPGCPAIAFAGPPRGAVSRATGMRAAQQEVTPEREGGDHQHPLRIVRPDAQAGDRRDEAAGQRDPDRPEQRRAGNRQQDRTHFGAGGFTQGEHRVADIVCWASTTPRRKVQSNRSYAVRCHAAFVSTAQRDCIRSEPRRDRQLLKA